VGDGSPSSREAEGEGRDASGQATSAGALHPHRQLRAIELVGLRLGHQVDFVSHIVLFSKLLFLGRTRTSNHGILHRRT
jgi:hypothetical protein